MNKTTIPFKNLRFSADVRRKLKSYQEREQNGSDVDYRTPFYSKSTRLWKSHIPNSRISGVTGRVALDRTMIFQDMMKRGGVQQALSAENDDITKFEKSFFGKVTCPRSILLPGADRVEALNKYFETPYFKPDKVLLNKAIEAVEQRIREYIPRRSLRLLSYEAAMDALPGTTNGGSPYFVEGKRITYDEDRNISTVIDHRHKYLAIAKKIDEAIHNNGTPKIEDIAFGCLGRGAEADGKVTKQRIVGGEAHGVTIIGSRLRPFIDAESRLPGRAALVSQEMVDKHIAESFKTYAGEYHFGFDAQGFDQHVHSTLMNSASQIILDSFNMNDRDYKLMKGYLQTHILTSPILTPDGLHLGRLHNMPSGTTFTNTLDSIVNLIAAYYVSFKIDHILIVIQVQGDDGDFIFLKAGPNDLASITAAYADLGFIVHPDKQGMSQTSVTYLKRLHTHDHKTSYRSYTGVMIGLCNMERAKGWKEAMYSARAIMQTSNLSPEYNGYNAFMKWASEGDFYGLGIKLKEGSLGVLKAAGGVKKVADRLGFNSFAANQQGLVRPKHGDVTMVVPNLNTSKGVAQQIRTH